MFIFKDPIRHDKPEPLDPVQVELERRILFAPPDDVGPFPTYDDVRAELDERRRASARARTLSEAGFGPPVRVVVVHDLDGGVERIVPVGTAIQQPRSAVPAAEVVGLPRRDLPVCDVPLDPEKGVPGTVLVDSEKKELSYKSRSDFSQITGTSSSETVTHPIERSFSGEGPVKGQSPTRRIRRRSEDIPWYDKTSIEAYEVSHYISKEERKSALHAYLVAMALKRPLNFALDINPDLDDMTPIERMRFLGKIPNNVNSYIQGRLEALKRPASYWPHHGITVRESEDGTHKQEHVHRLIHVPSRDEMERLVERLDKQRDNPLLRAWCGNPFGREVDDVEEWKDGKFHSAIGYLLKAADSQSTFVDPTILYKASGAVLGKRVSITRNLTNPRVIETTVRDVARHERIRAEKRLAARRRAARPSYPWE